MNNQQDKVLEVNIKVLKIKENECAKYKFYDEI